MKSKLIYIFLDIDGVLNDEDYIEECYNRHHKPMHMNHVPFDPKCLTNLMYLVQDIEKENYGVRIILSSTWRLHEVDYEIVNARLAEYGLTLSGKTPYLHGDRGKEIQTWLDHNDKCRTYIIIDDDIKDIMTLHPMNFVQTNFRFGFTREKKEEALQIFERGK